MEKHTFEVAMAKFGSVAANGIEIALTQSAYMENYGTDGGVRYYASGVDSLGNTYQIAWDTTQAWDDAMDRINAALRNGEEPSYLDSGLLQDESNACCWCNPASVVMTDAAE